jgi:hypothetical protein
MFLVNINIYMNGLIHGKFAELSNNLSGISVQEELAIIVLTIHIFIYICIHFYVYTYINKNIFVYIHTQEIC